MGDRYNGNRLVCYFLASLWCLLLTLAISHSFLGNVSVSEPNNSCALWLMGFSAACTCPGESHPGPVRRDGTYVGRAAPEIDILEALVEHGQGQVSMSAQWAPFNVRSHTVSLNVL